jgi:hypothetical protein
MVGGGVQLGPIGTTATNTPIVPAPDYYDGGKFGGIMIGKGNRSTRRKHVPVLLCPPHTPHAGLLKLQHLQIYIYIIYYINLKYFYINFNYQ